MKSRRSTGRRLITDSQDDKNVIEAEEGKRIKTRSYPKSEPLPNSVSDGDSWTSKETYYSGKRDLWTGGSSSVSDSDSLFSGGGGGVSGLSSDIAAAVDAEKQMFKALQEQNPGGVVLKSTLYSDFSRVDLLGQGRRSPQTREA